VDPRCWSSDGRSIIYSSDSKGQFDLYRRSADGTGAEELLYAEATLKVPASWSLDKEFGRSQRSLAKLRECGMVAPGA